MREMVSHEDVGHIKFILSLFNLRIVTRKRLVPSEGDKIVVLARLLKTCSF